MNKAARAYVVQFGGSMVVYCIVLIASIETLQHVSLALPWRILIALVPVVPTLFALAAFMRFLRGMDELQRRIQLEALAFAFGVVGFLSFAYGFLENVGLPQLSYVWILPVLIMFWGLGLAFAARRYH